MTINRTSATFSISLPPEMADELERVRRQEHRTRSELVREALRHYIRAAEIRSVQARIMAALSVMQSDPLSGDVVKLASQDAFRRRVGNYRIIFRIDFKALAIGIIDIQRRTT